MPVDCTFVVIPAFNEERCVGKVIRGVGEFLPSARIVMVDDRSTDDTARVARSAGASVIQLPVNSGYGVALQTGLIWAHRNGAQMVVTLDADGQHEPAEIPALLRPVLAGEADLSLGSRYLNQGARYHVPLLRRLGSRLFARIASRLIRQPVTDPTTGFQAMNRKVLDLYASLSEFPEQTPDADLIVYANLRHCRIVEVPVIMHADQGEGSMHGAIKSAAYVPKMLISILSVLIAGARKQAA
jgi:glycosyltransferase involved in cell wall biosynthesis